VELELGYGRLRAMHEAFTRHVVRLVAAALLLIAVAACGSSTAASPPTPSPTATARPTPTPVAATVATPEDAAALVIATNPIFAGAGKQDPEIIGASKWWTATPLDGGGYEIEITVGWGDCMAGCIERHTWTFHVGPDGALEKVAEEGDEVPSDLPA
jgi:hypothetical protein